MSAKTRSRGFPAGLSALLLAVVPGCKAPGGSESSLDQLAAWMTGSFSSADQAVSFPDDYFDIRLRMVPIWTDRTDGPWLYVEQAAASALDEPYRQRVYRLVAVETGVRSDVYELPGDPLAFAGDWDRPEAFDPFGPEDLVPRTGCSIWLEYGDRDYVGSTIEGDCSSTLRGAAYATSQVTITEHVLTSWDRGFDAHDEQVWGATAGPYVFVKTE